MIAFCFLTYDNIIPINIWNKFFNNIDIHKYKIYIHPKNKITENIYHFPINIVQNKIVTKSKSDISIVKAILQLLKEAYNNNINNNNNSEKEEISHYIFLSQNCIPLYNFNTLEKLIKCSNKSIVSFIDNNLKDRYFSLDKTLHKYISYKQFVKQQPNMILIKDDVKDLINHDLTIYFKNMVCPDEHYFINVLLFVFKKDVMKQQTHFCNYNLQKTQALEFKNINREMIDKIKSMGFLFMRKVYNHSMIDF